MGVLYSAESATMQVQGIRHLLTHNAKDFARFGDALVIEGIVKAD